MKTVNNTEDYLKKIRPELRKYTLKLLDEIGEIDESMKPASNTNNYLKKIHPELRKTLNPLDEINNTNENYKTKWLKRIDVCTKSGSLLGEIDDYLRAIKEISKNDEYSHLISDNALEDVKKISKNIESIYDRQKNTLSYPKTQEFEPFAGLEVDLAEYNENGTIKNIVHYHYESNEKTRSGIFFLEDCELIDPIEKNVIYCHGKTRDSTLFLRDDELSDLLESIEAHDNKIDIFNYYQEKIESKKADGKRIKLNISDKEILKYIEFDGIIPKLALTPQNHTQMIDENLIYYKNSSLVFTNFGYNLFKKIKDLY
ncbi:MAG: hypothetical protein KAT28_05215 [Candidatus Aenigmarchaeota archaeon]|nr:hypothetical protein [Candidatus Aenigmarchaeota archaeon]